MAFFPLLSFVASKKLRTSPFGGWPLQAQICAPLSLASKRLDPTSVLGERLMNWTIRAPRSGLTYPIGIEPFPPRRVPAESLSWALLTVAVSPTNIFNVNLKERRQCSC